MPFIIISNVRFLTSRRGLFGLLLIGLLLLGWDNLAGAAPSGQSADGGQTIFQQKCAACHTIGGGDLVGPDLKGVTERRERAWLIRWLMAPDQMLAQKDPIATDLLVKYKNVPMPNLGLTEAQAADLMAYLGAQPVVVPTPQPSQPAPTSGDPVLGKALFTGITRFQNGGPPCMACHSVAGIGALGGGALGPDLTPAFNKYGATGLATFLGTMPLPTMNAVWSTHPLTPDEQVHLRVFLEQASVSGRPIQATGQLAVLAIAGTVALLAAAQLYWRQRLTGVRRPMVGRQRLAPGSRPTTAR